ncbi:MAG: hypothetical protein ABI702_18455, partial [Burkholderiales bacterium]
SLDAEEVTLLELAEYVGEQLLLGVVADGVGGGLRLQLRRKALDEARASRDAFQATFLNVFGDDRPFAATATAAASVYACLAFGYLSQRSSGR